MCLDGTDFWINQDVALLPHFSKSHFYAEQIDTASIFACLWCSSLFVSSACSIVGYCCKWLTLFFFFLYDPAHRWIRNELMLCKAYVCKDLALPEGFRSNFLSSRHYFQRRVIIKILFNCMNTSMKYSDGLYELIITLLRVSSILSTDCLAPTFEKSCLNWPCLPTLLKWVYLNETKMGRWSE